MNFLVLRSQKLRENGKKHTEVLSRRENVFFWSPQPVKKGVFIKVQSEFKKNAQRSGKILPVLENSPVMRGEKQGTPPFIKKMEKFWEKVGSIKNRFPEFDPMVNNFVKIKESTSAKNLKLRKTGIPARFKEQSVCKSNSRSTRNSQKLLKIDLQLLKKNDGADITERVKIAKLVKKYEDLNKEGILKKKNIGDSWRWFTPKSNSSDRVVHFDLKHE